MTQKFQEFMIGEMQKSENILKETHAYDKLPEDIDKLPDYRKFEEKYGADTQYYWHKMYDIKACYEKLSVGYMYFNDREKAKKMFGFLSSIELPKSLFGCFNENPINDYLDWQANDSFFRKQVEKGAQIDLSKANPEMAKKEFEWAAKNLFQTDVIIEMHKSTKHFDFIVLWYFWRAYALIMLGSYNEAYKDLKNAVPYKELAKKRGQIHWVDIEYYMSNVLMLICEYEFNAREEVRVAAKKELERSINKVTNFFIRQDAYLYYYHLKQKFPNIFES